MTPQRPVLVATDFSDAADEAIRQAHAEALARKTRLVVCHVLPESLRVRVLFPHEAGVDLPAQATLEATARDMMRARLDTVLGHATVPIDLDVEAGSPHAGILDIADRVDAALIVTGPGPTAGRVARAAHFPVLVARPSPARGPVIGATDFSSAALPALRGAAETAAATGNPLVVMHCLDAEPAAAMAAAGVGGVIPMPFIPEAMLNDMTTEATRQLDHALETIGAPGRTTVLLGPPARALVDSAAAEGASRVVVGTHGRAGVVRLLLGSVAEYVGSHAPCSVLIVPLFERGQERPESPARPVAAAQSAEVSR